MKDDQRRKVILGGAGMASAAAFLSPPIFSPSSRIKSAFAATMNDNEPIADLPMRRLQLPKGGMGREYVIIQLYIQGKGPYDFMVDSGLTTELITPHLFQDLNLDKKSSSSSSSRLALSAGASKMQSLVELKDVSLCCGSGSGGSGGQFSTGEYLYPLSSSTSPLHAVVSDFPQEHMDPAHDPVEGMIGMEVLEQFDVDFDFPAGRLRLWQPHSVESVARRAGMLTINALVVNETRLLGFRVVPSKATKSAATQQKDSGSGTTLVAAQPFLGVVDCGASFSVVNWAAAPLLGLPPQNDKSYEQRPKVVGLGVDGQPQLLPTATVGLSYCGNPIVSKDNKSMAFEAPPSEWKPWSEIDVAVGDLPVFTQLLGDGITPYRGPAGVIGLDILSQRRLILETSAGRQRRIYVGRG